MEFYKKHGFKLFPCKMDKSPNLTKSGIGWRDTEAHLTYDQAEELASRGNLIGAWIPENMVVIDIDVNHVDKLGNPKENGLEYFKALCEEKQLPKQSELTTVVRTGSGGYHLYYKANEVFSQRQLTTSVDTRTHNGYVIAAGSPGYSFKNTNEPTELPGPFQEILKTPIQKAEKMQIERPLSADLLRKMLKKIPATNFSSNEEWLEFTMSIIATCGNSEEIIDIVTNWSRLDPAYADDMSIRTRLESFSPNGNITAATFLFILKKEGISPYYLQQVRKQIGAEFKIKSQSLITHYDLPIKLNMEQFDDRIDLAKAFFYLRDQAATTRLIEYLVKDKLIHERSSKEFYFFDGNRWVRWAESSVLVYNILVVVADECFVRFGKEDADCVDILNECLNTIGQVHWRQQIVTVLRQSEMIGAHTFPWDSPDIKESLTFSDGVVDFSNGTMEQRKGQPTEYRRSFIDLKTEDVINAPEPDQFIGILANIFPNAQTRITALQALSLSVSGTGKFRKFQIWNGPGKNGKSFLMEAMQKVIGDRAITYNTNILLQKKGGEDANQVTPGMAKFRGTLLACGSETEESRKISQGMVKNITGHESITARALYQDEVTFQTTFQVVLATNYLPIFSAYDEAFIDRLLVIPFHTSFFSSKDQEEDFKARRRKYIRKAQNPNVLMDQVVEERAAILKKLIKTYMDLGDEIMVSVECREQLDMYIDDNNDLGKFLDTYCEFCDPSEKDSFTATKPLVDFFNEENNSRYSSQWMNKRLKQLHPELKMGRKRIDGAVQRGFYGVRFNAAGITFEGEF